MARNQAASRRGNRPRYWSQRRTPTHRLVGQPEGDAAGQGEGDGDGAGQAGAAEEADGHEDPEAAEEHPVHGVPPGDALRRPAEQTDGLLDQQEDQRQADHEQQGQGQDVEAPGPAGHEDVGALPQGGEHGLGQEDPAQAEELGETARPTGRAGGGGHRGKLPAGGRVTVVASLTAVSDESVVGGLKPRSREVTDGFERAGARAMLRAVGMTDDDWDKPQVAVASSWNEVTPCNLPLDRLAKRSKEGVRDAGGFPLEFTTIAVSDGISMGHEGMRASLVSREVIADSVELMMHAERLDALVTFAGCDKSLPGMLMAAARVNMPAVFLYGGSILPGQHNGQALDIVDVFEAVGAVRRRDDRRGGAGRDRAQRLPDRGLAAPACSPPTRWRRWPRPSACRCRARRRPRRSTVAGTTSPTSRARRWSSCCAGTSDPARS